MRRFNLSAWAVAHPALMLFLIVMFGVAGLLSYRSLGRAEDPSFTIKVVVVTAMWPGATAADMQAQVADPIEKKLQELPYFDKVTTYTKPSFTAMQVAFKDNTPARDVPELFYQLRKKIGDIKDELPAGLIGPSVNDEYGDVDSILYMLTADGADYAQMKKVAEGAPPASAQGQERHQGQSLRHAGRKDLSSSSPMPSWRRSASRTDQIFQSLARQNAVVPAGTVETAAQRVPLRVTGALDGAKAVAETPVEANGRVFRLGDIATVTHGFVDPPSFQVRQEGKPAIGIGVVMAKGANILELGPAVADATADIHGRGAARLRTRADRRSAGGRRARGRRVRPFLHRGAGDRAVRQLPRARLAYRHRRRAVRPARAGDRLHRHERDGPRPAPDHARRLDHRTRPAGRRRHHRRRDDGGEDGARLGPHPRGLVRLGVHRLSDADGDAGDGRRIPADRLCQFVGRRICRRHLLGRRDRAGGVVARGRGVHALHRREAPCRPSSGRSRARPARDLRHADSIARCAA